VANKTMSNTCSFWHVEEVEVVAKMQPPAKTSTYASFRGWKRWWWWSEAVSRRNERTRHISKGGGGGSVGKESPPSGTSAHGEVVVFSTIHGSCGGGGVGKESPPSDTSVHGSCGEGGGVGKESPPSDMALARRWWCSASNTSVHGLCRCRGDGGVLHRQIRAHTAGGGVSKESPPSKTSVCGLFLRVVVVVALAKS
jgi:hypothetical protein